MILLLIKCIEEINILPRRDVLNVVRNTADQNEPTLKSWEERPDKFSFSTDFFVEQSNLPLRKVNKRKKKQVRKTSIQKL